MAERPGKDSVNFHKLCCGQSNDKDINPVQPERV